MQNQTKAKQKPKPKQYVDDNPIEAVKSFGTGVVDSFANDMVKGSITDFWDQLLGGADHDNSHSNAMSGDLSEGQEIDLSHTSKQEKKSHPDLEPGIDYAREIIHGERRIASENAQEIHAQIQEIIIELKRIVSSSQVLEVEFKEVVVDQRITKPGKYHVNFFQFVLTLVRQARMKIEDSGAWLAQSKSKKGEKQYWSMFKKHGTSFGLSNERNVATQVG